ncbi:MAG: HDIG domain-containing metalloprotein [Candidatus Omnitrophota bacterium]|jgi:hypothetical protein
MKNTTIKTTAGPRPAASDGWKFWAKQAGVFFAAFVAATVLVTADHKTGFVSGEFNVGDPAPKTLFAPFGMTIVDEKATEALRRKSSELVPPVYSINSQAAKDAFRKLDHFLDLAARVKAAEEDISRFEAQPLRIGESTLRDLVYRLSQEEVSKQCDHLLMHYFGKGIFDSGEKDRLEASGVPEITVVSPEIRKEHLEKVTALQSLSVVQSSAEQILPPEVARNADLKSAILEIFRAVAVPNTVLNEEETSARKKRAAEQAGPVEVSIKKEELIVQRGMLVTPEQQWKIDAIQKKQVERQIVNKALAVALLVFAIYFLFFMYFFFYGRKIIPTWRTVFLMHAIILLTLGLSKLACWWPGASAYWMPTAVAPILLVLLVHPRLGLLASAMITVLTAPLSGFAPEVLLAVLLSGVSGSLVATHVRRRTQFLRLGVVVGLAHAVPLFAYHVFREYSVLDSLGIAAPGLANGLVIAMPACFLLLPILEWMFNLVTDISLLELSDLNHPLMKRMIVEAPGTYHHSLVVSSLAEAACEAIGANGLLARVGAYFHDIGKIARGQMFVENQSSKILNKHESMPPEMSCRLIRNHVRDGLDLGRRYKLKDRILQFIAEHQGTGMIYYFYRKAVESAPPGETVSADDYRYPGPKPQSRETAVVLLADSLEAASRALEEPSPETVCRLVRRIVHDKLSDGQLDECDLTLKDVRRIEDNFVTNLTAIMHTRMSYPSFPDEDSGDRVEEWEEQMLSGPGSGVRRPHGS